MPTKKATKAKKSTAKAKPRTAAKAKAAPKAAKKKAPARRKPVIIIFPTRKNAGVFFFVAIVYVLNFLVVIRSFYRHPVGAYTNREG